MEYLRRMLRLAKALPQRHANTTVACFSHAASVALVAALTKQDSLLSDAELTFAPCGIYKLVSDDGGDTWAVEASGASNAAHVTVNDPTTYSWGFMHSSSAQRNEADWKRARLPSAQTTSRRSVRAGRCRYRGGDGAVHHLGRADGRAHESGRRERIHPWPRGWCGGFDRGRHQAAKVEAMKSQYTDVKCVLRFSESENNE